MQWEHNSDVYFVGQCNCCANLVKKNEIVWPENCIWPLACQFCDYRTKRGIMSPFSTWFLSDECLTRRSWNRSTLECFASRSRNSATRNGLIWNHISMFRKTTVFVTSNISWNHITNNKTWMYAMFLFRPSSALKSFKCQRIKRFSTTEDTFAVLLQTRKDELSFWLFAAAMAWQGKAFKRRGLLNQRSGTRLSLH